MLEVLQLKSILDDQAVLEFVTFESYEKLGLCVIYVGYSSLDLFILLKVLNIDAFYFLLW